MPRIYPKRDVGFVKNGTQPDDEVISMAGTPRVGTANTHTSVATPSRRGMYDNMNSTPALETHSNLIEDAPPAPVLESRRRSTLVDHTLSAISESPMTKVMLRKGILRRPPLGLHEAIHRGQLKVVAQICSERVGLPSIDESGIVGASSGWNETPLMVACQAYHLPQNEQLDLVETLLQAGAHMDLVDKDGRSPLALAIYAAPLGSDISRSSSLTQISPHWLERGSGCLVRDSKRRNLWSEGTVLTCYTEVLRRGGMTMYDVRTKKEVLRGVLPADVCPDKAVRSGKKVTLGCHVLYKDEERWTSGVVTAMNPRGGYDVIPITLPVGPGAANVTEIRGTLTEHAMLNQTDPWRGLLDTHTQYRPPFTPDQRQNAGPMKDTTLQYNHPNADPMHYDSEEEESQQIYERRVGLSQQDLRFCVTSPVSLRPATEGQLYPGASVEIFLPSWSEFRPGMIQGRNTLQGGYNVLLREELDPATGMLTDPSYKWVKFLFSTGYRSRGPGGMGGGLRSLERLSHMRKNGRTRGEGERLIQGVHIEWISVPLKVQTRSRGRVGLVIEKLCKPRRLGMRGKFVMRDHFDTEDRWLKQVSTERQIHQGLISANSPLSGSQVVALCTKYNCLQALEQLKQQNLIKGKRDVFDWVDGKEVINLITDPEILKFFLELDIDFKLARAVRLSGGVAKSQDWTGVIKRLLRNKHNDPFFWTAASPKGSGLNAIGWVCKYGRDDLLELLLQHKEAVGIAVQPHRTSQDPLFLTAKSKVMESTKLTMCKRLVKVGVSVMGSRALVAAIEEAYLELIAFFLNEGADPTQQLNGVLPQRTATNFMAIEALIHNSSANGKSVSMLPVTIVRRALLFPKGSRDREGWLALLESVTGDWNAWDPSGNTALSLATRNEDVELLRRLLLPGRCNPNVRTSQGEYCIGLSCELNRHHHVTQALLSSGSGRAEGIFLRGTLALPRVCQRGHEQLFNVLLDYHQTAKKGPKSIDFNESLHTSKEGSVTLVELLLRHPEVETSPRIRNMVMVLAELRVSIRPALIAKHGWYDVLEQVLTRGDTLIAPVPTPGQISALMYAISKGDQSMVRFLVKCGADLTQTDNCGRGVLVLALESPLEGEMARTSEEEKNKVRYALLHELLARGDAKSLIKSGGVLASAARRNHLEAIYYLNSLVDSWCEEDEMVLSPDTKERVSPVVLATDQRVQRLLIEQNGFLPNIADLAKCGKFGLVQLALRKFAEQKVNTISAPAPTGPGKYTATWATICTQKSTCLPAETETGVTHTTRTALGWILPKRFQPIDTLHGLARGLDAFKQCDREQCLKWGIDAKSGYILGTARLVRGWDEQRLEPMTPNYSGLVEWHPVGLDHVYPLIMPLHELLFKQTDRQIFRGKAVLVRRETVGRMRQSMANTSLGMHKQHVSVFQKVYIVDIVEETEDGIDNIHHIPTQYLVTTEGVQHFAGASVKVKTPFKISSADCIAYVRASDISNECAANLVIGLFNLAGRSVLQQSFRDEHGVSILELAARGGDLELVQLVLDKFSDAILNFDVRSNTLTPLDRAVAGLSSPTASALCAAVAARKFKVVNFMLESGIAFATDMKQGRAAGKWACTECVMRLLRKHWNGEVGEHLYDLAKCARRGWYGEVDVLLDAPYNADVNKEDSNLSTPLMEAARGGHVDLFGLLLTRNAIVDKFDNQGRSVLTILASLDSKDLREPAFEMVKTLLGSEVTYSNNNKKAKTAVRFRQEEKENDYPFASESDAGIEKDADEADLKTSFIRRSKALTVAVSSNSPNLAMIELLMEHGSRPDETNAGKTALRHLGCNATYIDSNESMRHQQQAASLVLRKLLSWVVEVAVMNHLHRRRGDVISVGSRGSSLKVKFEIPALYDHDPPTTVIEHFTPSEVIPVYKGPASSGLMSHLDFMHVVSMGWPDVVGLMVDLESIEGYYKRTLPFICGDSLKEALLQCLQTLGPIWKKQNETEKEIVWEDAAECWAAPEQLPPPEWYVLRHLLRGLNEAHSYETHGPSLQQAVNELLAEEKETLGLIPLSLYKEAISNCRDDKTFFSELFILHQHKLKRELCENWGKQLRGSSSIMDPAQYEADFAIFKSLFEHGKEFEGAEGTLEIAAAYGWVDAVKWLIEGKGTNANDTNTANRPIRTVALEVSAQYQDITGENLQHFMDTCGELSGGQYIEFMRDRDVHGARYYYANSLNDTILQKCSQHPMMQALVELALILFANGADADPDDFERLSQVMRLDQPFDAFIQGEVADQVSLLHVAAACDNVNSVRWLLENIAYRDTVGSGIMEDKRGRTARSYTGSHACHQVLAKKEQDQHALSGYMPPQEQINLVVALRVEDVFNSVAVVQNLEKFCGQDGALPIGVTTVLHALNMLDLGGFVLYYQEEIYVVVSGTDKRQFIHADRYPQVRFCDKNVPLLSKEKHCITSRLVNNFTWPILDLKLQTAVQHLEKSFADFRHPDNELQEWVNTRQWLNYGHEVTYPYSLKVSCRDMAYCGDYEVDSLIPSASPIWNQVDGPRVIRADDEGKWCIFDKERPVLKTTTEGVGRSPAERFVWQAAKGETMWRPDKKVFVTDGDEKRTTPSWILVDECADVVYALLTDKNPPNGARPFDMTKRLIRVVSSLPDGCPDTLFIEATAFPEIDGEYTREKTLADDLHMVWVNANGKFKLHVTFTRSSAGDPEESVGITYARPDSPNPGIVSMWGISSYGGGTETTHLELRSDDLHPWFCIGEDAPQWVNVSSKTKTPLICFTLPEGAAGLLPGREMLERKTRAMWSLRQALLASGMPRDTLPFRKVNRLEPDVPSLYMSPNLDTPGNLPPGQNWLDLLKQEKKIAQVFGVHSQSEAKEVLEEWQPDFTKGYACLFMPWLWQPFSCIWEFLRENPHVDSEKKYDPLSRTVCDRKTFLNLEPIASHTSAHWDVLERIQTAALDTPLFRERETRYYSNSNIEPADMLHKGTGIIPRTYLGEWVFVEKENDEWWLPVVDDRNVTLLREVQVDKGSSCYYRAVYDLTYCQEVFTKGGKEERCKGEVEPLKREQEIEVLYLDLEGKWARVRHHAKAVYFKSYWMPLRTQDRSRRTLTPFYLSQLSKLEAYLGSKVAFYFAFLATYCAYLLLLLMSGVCFTVVQFTLGLHQSDKIVMWNAILVLFWGAYFRKRWVRKASELTYMWNVRNVEQWEPAMAEFLKNNMKRQKRPHPITGLSEPYFTSAHRRPRLLLSVVVTSALLSGVVFVMYQNAILRDEYSVVNQDMKLMFGVENAITIAAMDVVYALIAGKLNFYENHRTKSSKQSSAILKNFVFRFINGFSGLMITVIREPVSVADCLKACHQTLCKIDNPMTVDGGTLAGGCPTEAQLDEEISVFRKYDLMVQLTTQLIIQSLIALMTEKVIPKIILNHRHKRKREAGEEVNTFPSKLSCLALDTVSRMSEVNRVVSFHNRKYYLTCRGKWSVLRSKQYGGIWESEKTPGDLYLIRQEDTRLYCSVRAKARKCSSPHATKTTTSSADNEESDNEAIDMPSHTEVYFPIPSGPNKSVTTDIKGLWSTIESQSTYDRMLVYPEPDVAGEPTDPFIIVRREEIIKGTTSPHAQVNLSVEDRRDASIPQSAVSFVWMYNISDDVDVVLGNSDDEVSNTIRPTSPGAGQVAVTKQRRRKRKDRPKDHKDLDNIPPSSPQKKHTPSRKKEPRTRKSSKKGHVVKLADAVGDSENGLSSETHVALRVIANGAYAYFDSFGDVVSINAVQPSSDGRGLSFEDPKPWRPEFTKGLWRQGRFQPVTLPFLRNFGARWYCWLYPKEEIEGDIAGEPLWKVSTAGSFVYLFDPESKKEFRADDPRPSHPPEAHPLNRYFTIRQRQVDTKMTVIVETMRPPVSEESEFDDYTMMMLQFSYVVCFGSVLPLAPLVALFTGWIELHTDILKYLKLQQRPEAMKASGIGAWLTLLTTIIYVSIPVNVLIVMKSDGRTAYWNHHQDGKEVLLGVLLTLVLVQVVKVVMALLPGTAGWVVQHELRRDYERL